MTYDLTRYSAFDSFACGRNGNSLRQRIHAMARHYAIGHVVKIDPNWHSIEISFDSKLIEQPFKSKDSCHVEFDYSPTEFTLIGPKVGHVDLLKQAFQMIPEPLFMLMRTCDVIKTWHHALFNPKHVVELIEGKTVIDFENCDRGVVRNVNGNDFDVKPLGDTRRAFTHYTREQLLQEMKMDEMQGQAVGVDYFPFLPNEGMSRNNAEEYEECNRIAFAKYQVQREAERAQQEIDEAAAYANLSEEERAKVDNKHARLREQTRVIRHLLPILPQP